MNNTTDNNLSQQDAGNSRASFASTDLLGEVEAVLRNGEYAERAFDRGLDDRASWYVREMVKALRKIIAGNPRHSPSEKDQP